MPNLEQIGQLIGFVALGFSLLIFQQKKRGSILAYKLISDTLWTIHHALLFSWSGMVVCIIGCLRSITFVRIGKKSDRTQKIWLFIFLTIGTVLIFLSWKNVWSVFSLISTILATVGYWQKNPNRMKLFMFLVSLSQLTYGTAISSFSMILNEILSLASLIIFFIRTTIKKEANKDGTT